MTFQSLLHGCIDTHVVLKTCMIYFPRNRYYKSLLSSTELKSFFYHLFKITVCS